MVNFGISDSPDSFDFSSQKILFFAARIDERGRIIVPAPIRRTLQLSFGSAVFVGIEKASECDCAKDALDADNSGNSGSADSDSGKEAASGSDSNVPENKEGGDENA